MNVTWRLRLFFYLSLNCLALFYGFALLRNILAKLNFICSCTFYKELGPDIDQKIKVIKSYENYFVV